MLGAEKRKKTMYMFCIMLNISQILNIIETDLYNLPLHADVHVQEYF